MNTTQNPLLAESKNPFGAPAFDKIKNEHYKPAFEAAISKSRAEIESITNNPEAPTFKNSIEALEYAGRDLSYVSSIFFSLDGCATDSVMQQIALDVSPMLTEYSSDIILNKKLFARVKHIYDSRESLNLDAEQFRLTEETYKNFARNGASLSEEKRAKFRDLNKDLSITSLQFGQNLLAATNRFVLHITDPTQLQGLPEYVKEAASYEAKTRSLEGWVFTLQSPSYSPFMQYSANRELREKIWKASNSRAFNDEFDNQKNIERLVDLRLQKANILGFRSYADYALQDNMAKSPERVNIFLSELLDKTLPHAKKEILEIQQYANSIGLKGGLKPWDFSYYSEKYKSEKFSLNDELLKPYFQLESVQRALFALADSLYGLKFTERKDIPSYHADVKIFEIRDSADEFMALLYLDFFPRESKRGGAWMTSFRDEYHYKGNENRPFIQIVCNFTKPTEEAPSLLTFNEVVTFLHEFGHGLHGILAEGRYPSLTGTSVSRDFVELPSQIMENWATEKEFLISFAKHYKTGEAIPSELIDKIVSARNFLSGYAQIRQLSFGLCDIAWHSIKSAKEVTSVEQFEREAMRRTQLLPAIDSTCFSTSFGHIFSGGYSAGYYSYKWAEVLEADAFSMFKESGIFNRDIADSFRKNILSKGNLEDPAILFRNFRGRDPEPEALIEKLGLAAQQHK